MVCFSTGFFIGLVVRTINTTQHTFSEVIEAFSISDEKLIHVPLPEESTPLARRVCKSVGMLEDCLCLVVSMLDIRTDVWVMQKYRVRESWTKKITISQSAITKSCYPKLIWARNDDSSHRSSLSAANVTWVKLTWEPKFLLVSKVEFLKGIHVFHS
ncbi:F-box protein CPR1-like [Papaver somniferum]|uniref:F-box protein CPR1-like n=1 Tax=Papaver somniferum TaxID=3469 RepID=UPI000E6F702E|nr:F-box protein CPR1-like [Papaver somniferum]